MPETACLHIQARDSDPIRVVEIPGTSVRIGRASFCEVRLSEPDIAEEECRLRRKGGQWQLIPSRSAGFVWIDGRSVEQTCPIPFDVPFRVGEHWLTLRPNGSAPAWRDYQAPEPTASASLLEELRADRDRGRAEAAEEPRPSPPRPTATDDHDHLSRWKERQEERSSRARTTPQHERRWEERWRAAGERLRSRASTAASPPRTTEPPRPATAPAYRSPASGTVDFRDATLRRTNAPAPPRAPNASEAPSIASLGLPTVPVNRHYPAPPPTVAPARPAPMPTVSRDEPPAAADWFLAPAPSPSELAENGRDASEAPIAAILETLPQPDAAVFPVSTEAPAQFEVIPHEPQPSDSVADFEASTALPPLGEPRPVELLAPEETPPEASSRPAPATPDLTTVKVEAAELASIEATASEPEALEATASEPSVPEATAREDAPVIGPSAEHSSLDDARVADFEPSSEPDLPTPTLAQPVSEPNAAVASVAPTDAPQAPPFVTDTDSALSNENPVETARPDFSTTVHVTGISEFPDPPAPQRPARPAVSRPVLNPRPEGKTSAGSRFGVTARGPERRKDPASGRAAVPPESSREWPTVRDILDAHRAQTVRAATPRPATSPDRSEPLPTNPVEPASWSFPLWLAWLPCVALALGTGTIGLALAWTWSMDARKAGMVANLLAAGTAEVKPLPPQFAPPDGSWWKSTPANLMLWALYFDRRSGAEPENAELSLELLETAARGSPLQPQVRFALARRPEEVDDQASMASSLGVSRDVVALGWAAHQWLKAGKKEAALKQYRAALEMASRASLTRLPLPAFDDDPHIKRYRLPGEEMIGTLVRDMADHEGWTYADWSEALPPYAVVSLTAARLLREKGNPDSEKALDAIITNLDAPPPQGCSRALHLAAQAEALAFRSEWAKAEARYREAIAAMPVDAVRRSWWLNVSDIVLKLNNESGRQKALEAAKGNDANDEIARRAIDILKYSVVSIDKPRPAR